jgi:hypothetical protein
VRTVSYLSVLQQAAFKAGFDPLDASWSSTLAARFGTGINLAVRKGWRAYWWPELTPIELRQFRPEYDSSATYAAPTPTAAVERRYRNAVSDGYYQTLRASTGQPPVDAAGVVNYAYWFPCQPEYDAEDWATGQVITADANGIRRNPADGRYYACHTAHTAGTSFDATKFGILTPFRRNVELAATGQTAIGEVRAVWDADPQVIPGAQQLPFLLTQNGVVVTGRQSETVLEVWVEFRLRVNSFTGTPWTANAVHTAGQQYYYAASSTEGDYYRCDTTHTATGSFDPTKFTVIEFPYVLAEYAAHYAYAHHLLYESNPQLSGIEMNVAKGILHEEMSLLEIQQAQNRRMRVRVRQATTA